MVATIKFSEFTTALVGDVTSTPVGLSEGVNSKLPPNIWNVATRPLTPYNGLLGYNTDLLQYEYWNGTSWIQLLTSENGFNWSIVITSSANADVNSGYVANRSSTPVNLLLPSTMLIGDIVEVMGIGTAGWVLTANAGQQIVFGNQISSTGGSWASTLQYDNIIVKGLVPNTLWSVTGGVGNFTRA